MEDYTLLKQLLVSSCQTPAFSDEIIKSIDAEVLYETLSEQPVDEIIVTAFMESDDIDKFEDSIKRSIKRLQCTIRPSHLDRKSIKAVFMTGEDNYINGYGEVLPNSELDFEYDEHDNFYILLDGKRFEEPSTAFKFIIVDY